MKFLINKGTASLLLAAIIGLNSCQKMEQPPLGDYPEDANPPGGPLKFYAAFDGVNVDSIRANFGTPTNVTYVPGASDSAMQAGADGHMVYPSANDLGKFTSFTVAFWVKKDGPNPAGAGTAFAFGIATSKDIWTSQDMFLEFEDAGNPSSKDSAAAKFYVNDQWFEFTGVKRIPKVLDGQWHHLAFVFDSASATLTPYVDGSTVANLPDGFGKFTNNNGVMDLSSIGGVVVGGPGMFALGKTPEDIGQTWMGNFNGGIDQFRLYGEALSAADVKSLYDNKQ
jgi:concanavalin A-like lectin/glucanase superfamily protein